MQGVKYQELVGGKYTTMWETILIVLQKKLRSCTSLPSSNLIPVSSEITCKHVAYRKYSRNTPIPHPWVFWVFCLYMKTLVLTCTVYGQEVSSCSAVQVFEDFPATCELGIGYNETSHVIPFPSVIY